MARAKQCEWCKLHQKTLDSIRQLIDLMERLPRQYSKYAARENIGAVFACQRIIDGVCYCTCEKREEAADGK